MTKISTLIELAEMLAGADLELRAVGEDKPSPTRSYKVQPPSTRTAIVLLATWSGAATIDETDDDGVLFWEEVRAWLGPTLSDELQKPDVRLPAIRGIKNLLAVGVPVATTIVQAGESAADVIDRAPWGSLAMDVMARYRVDPFGLPWPVFLLAIGEVSRIEAASQARFIEAYLSTKSEVGLVRMNQIFERAYPHAAKVATIEEPEWMDDEWYAAQLAKAHRIRRDMVGKA